MIQAEKLALEEHIKTKALWKEIFSEDTERYLDYYYKEVAPQNEIYVTRMGEDMVSMLHLNPYSVCMGKKKADVHFIVAVAAKKSYRHQGRMAAMLHRAFYELYEKKEPFTFLTPASEDIYLPFGFRTVSVQETLTVCCREKTDADFRQKLRLRPAEEKDLAEASKFSSDILAGNCMVYADRSLSYMKRCQREQKAMNGGILLFYRGNRLTGYCFSGDEGGPEVWEVILAPEKGSDTALSDWDAAAAEAVGVLSDYFSGRQSFKIKGFLPDTRLPQSKGLNRQVHPASMVRIVNLSAFVERMTAKEHLEFEFLVQDQLIRENNGSFRFVITPNGGRLIRLNRAARQTVTVETVTDLFFGKGKAFPELSGKLNVLCPVCFTELV